MAKNKNKGKQKAKRRRKELKMRIQAQKEAAKQRREENAERKRRYAGEEPKLKLPEDWYWCIREIQGGLEAERIIDMLYDRQFFYRLQKKLEGSECDCELTISTQLLQGMGFEKERIETIKSVLENNGGYCDCEVIYNVYLPNCLGNYVEDYY